MGESRAEVASVETSFDAGVFVVDVIKRAAYKFSDRATFDFRPSEGEIVCRLDFASPLPDGDAKQLLAAFRNEVLDQDLRRSIADETAPIRNAVLAYAFSRTGLSSE